MKISRELRNEIIDLLAQYLTQNDRTRLLHRAFAGSAQGDRLLTQIDLENAPANFSSHVVDRLLRFGEVDNEPAILRLLTVIRDEYGGGENYEKLQIIIRKLEHEKKSGTGVNFKGFLVTGVAALFVGLIIFLLFIFLRPEPSSHEAILFMLDTSENMQDLIEGTTKYDLATQIISGILNSNILSDDAAVGVQPVGGGDGSNCNRINSIVEIEGDATGSDFLNQLPAIQPQGNTAYAAGFNKSLQWLTTDKIKAKNPRVFFAFVGFDRPNPPCRIRDAIDFQSIVSDLEQENLHLFMCAFSFFDDSYNFQVFRTRMEDYGVDCLHNIDSEEDALNAINIARRHIEAAKITDITPQPRMTSLRGTDVSGGVTPPLTAITGATFTPTPDPRWIEARGGAGGEFPVVATFMTETLAAILQTPDNILDLSEDRSLLKLSFGEGVEGWIGIAGDLLKDIENSPIVIAGTAVIQSPTPTPTATPTPTPIPDSDSDGIVDTLDNCPLRGDEGLGVDAAGCPYYDADRDSVFDRDDSCPAQGDEGSGVDVAGCPIATFDCSVPFNCTPIPELNVTIFIDMDSLTILIPADQSGGSLEDFGFSVTSRFDDVVMQKFYLQDYGSFSGILNNAPANFCFRLLKSGTSSPLPLECNSSQTLTQLLTNADIFWFDGVGGIPRTIILIQGDETLGVCGAGQSRCEVTIPQEINSPDS